jgi:hypothetical protein
MNKNRENFPLYPIILSLYQVDVLTRIPKYPHLHFSDFLLFIMNFQSSQAFLERIKRKQN